MRLRKLLSTFSLLLVSIITFGQVTTSSMTGSIRDDKNEGLIGATVKATHMPSGTVYGTVTRADGNYTIPGMRIGGPYKVEISYIGYQTKVLEGINLSLGEAYVINEKLTSGQNLQTVNIVGERSARLGQNKTGASTVINTRQLSTLPTVSRNITDFTRLTPQANGNNFGGRDGRYNNIQVDGANLNNNFGLSNDPMPGGGASPISLDAYDQISVNIAPYDVRQSGFTGAGINAVTKSGTNEFHGSLYGFYRDQSFNGTKVHDNVLTFPKTENKIIGGTLGGPIIKNKLFFFVSAEFEKSKAPGITTTPKGGSGQGTVSSTPIDSLKKLSDFLISKYGYNPGAYDNFPTFDTKNHKILAKIDWNINSVHKLTLKYSDFKGSEVAQLNATSVPNSTIGPFFVTGGSANGDTRLPNSRFGNASMSFNNSNYGFDHTVRSGTVELNSTFNAKMSNQLILTYTRNQDTRNSLGSPFPTVDIFDGTGKNYISFGTDPFTRNNDVINKIFSATDNFTYYANKHTFTGGITYEHQKLGNMFMPGSSSYYIYNTLQDFMTDKAPAFYANTYSLIPGTPSVYSAELKIGQLGVYAQDEYQVNEKLRLTLGVRADLPIYGQQPLENPAISALQFPDKNGNMTNYSTGTWPKKRILLSPRFGFRWDVEGDKSFIVRGGTGIFTGKIPFVYLTNMPTNSGMYQNQVVINKAADLAGIKFNPDPGTYLGKFPTTPSNVAPAGFTLIDPNFKFPQVFRTNIGVDKALGAGFVFTFDAMYTKDINAVRMRNANLKDPTSQLNANGDNRPWYPPTQTKGDKFVNVNQTSVILMENTSKGHSLALTAQVTKTFSNGLYGSVAYTFTSAKDVTGNPGNQAASIWQLNPNIGTSNAIELYNSQYSIPHRVVANISYRREYAKHFASTLSLFYEGQNLGRISYLVNGDINGDGNNAADLMYIYAKGTDVNFAPFTPRNSTRQFTVAEQQAAYDQFISNSKYLSKHKGEYAERNGALLPWYNKLDARFLQDFYITTKNNMRHTLQFSVDMLNLPNLLNKNWGVRQQTTFANPLVSKGVDATGKVTYNMTNVDNNTLLTSPFQDTRNNLSTWGMQLGLRYSF
ncbi:carboxypeptidase regulatory-like domain-containing protein [Chitinophaga sp. 212800010-3]|uniref:TonB-dependent receptor n=1 Tax=unclassified Chitinophaga TaxID=2619133 RepID=UPI002DEFBD60|nr:TonB-dep-Rec domain-containing protein [Chitinophaga sp. 212800010-3]